MSVRAAVAFLACAFLAFACMSPEARQEERRRAEVDDVREAVFRYEFEHNASAAQNKVRYYFISIDDGKVDPTPQFLARFKDISPRVLPGSAGAQSPLDTRIHHKIDGAKGLSFNVGEIKWIGDDKVEVEGGYFESGLSASGNTYTVERRSGVWTVTENHMWWIS